MQTRAATPPPGPSFVDPRLIDIKTPQTTQDVSKWVLELVGGDHTFDTPAIKRIETLGHAAKHAIAQNALLTAENTRLKQQNQERSQQKPGGAWVLGRARLMTAADVETACRVCQQGSLTALPQPTLLSPPPMEEDGNSYQDFAPDSDDFADMTLEYLELYGDA